MKSNLQVSVFAMKYYLSHRATEVQTMEDKVHTEQ